MALQPIDLQTLFTQVDKVGKAQSLQREGLQIQASLQQLESQRKTEAQYRAVNEAQTMEEEAENVKNDDRRRQSKGQEGERREPPEEKEGDAAANPAIIRDHRLGRNIDLSG